MINEDVNGLDQNQREKIGPMKEANSQTSTGDDLSESGLLYYYDYSPAYRWIMLVGITFLACLIGPPFMNWPPLREILSDSGAFNHLCDNPGNLIDITCPDKVRSLENLGGKAGSIYFSCIILCGIFFDFFGAKFSAITGLAISCLGWILLSLSGPNFSGHSIGMLILSASVDLTYFGLVSVGNLFPGYTSSILALLGSARSVSFAIPLLMKKLFDAGLPFQQIGLIFAAILGSMSVLCAIFLPYQPYPKLSPQNTRAQSPASNELGLRQHVNTMNKISPASAKILIIQQVKDVLPYLKNWTFWMFVFVMSVALIRNSYFIETSKTHFAEIEYLYTYMSPLSFIPCPVIGLLVDKFSAALTCGLLALFGAAALIFVMINTLISKCLSIFANWIFISFVASQCYCFIFFVYPQKILGKLTGLTLLVAGLMSFSSNWMNRFARESWKHTLIMDSIVIVLEVTAIIATLFLYKFVEQPLKRRLNRPLKDVV